MAKTIAKLNIQLGANSGVVTKAFSQVGGAARNLERKVEGVSVTLSRVGASIAILAARAAAFLGVTGGAAGLGFAAKLAADAEQAEVAFTTLLGNAEDAKQLLKEIQDFSAATPFQLPELRDAARMLAAFGVEAENIVPQLTRIGDISAGIGAPIGEIAEIFGKARVQGRLFMEDINQLTGRGIPIIQELAKQFGVTEAEVRELVTDGKVHFKNLEEAFKSLTGEGGKFAGLMAAQSQTLSGVFSTLKDNVSALFTELGTKLMPAFKATAEGALALTDAIRNVDAHTVRNIAVLGTFVTTFGAIVTIIPKVVAGIRAVILALRALTVASIMAQVASGVGLLTVLASIAIAGAAAFAMGSVFDKFTESANEATEQTQALANSVGSVQKAGDQLIAAPSKIIAPPKIKGTLPKIHSAAAIVGSVSGEEQLARGQFTQKLGISVDAEKNMSRRRNDLLESIDRRLATKTPPITVKKHKI